MSAALAQGMVKTMLIKRLLTAVVFIPQAILATLKFDSSEFALAIMPVLVISSWEYSRLIKINHWLTKTLYIVVLTTTAYYLNQMSALLMPILIVTLLWWLINLFWIINFHRYTRSWYNYPAMRIINGFLFFIPLLVALTALHQIDKTHVLLLLALVWAADTGAYLVGRKIGKNKLLPNVSPGKTVEGAAGGILFSFGTMLIYVYLGHENADFTLYFFYGVLSLIAALSSILGDLFESLYKQAAGVKDSGILLPGHGGLFDRIDSLTASAPIFLLAYSFLA